MNLLRVGMRQYRSIGSDFVMLDLNKKLNVLVGANNSGKSNVLRGLQVIASKPPFPAMQETEKHRRILDLPSEFRVEFELGPNEGVHANQSKVHWITWPRQTGKPTASDTSLADLDFDTFAPIMLHVKQTRFTAFVQQKQLRPFAIDLAQTLLDRVLGSFPEVLMIPQYRQIGTSGEYSLSGGGIVELLAAWQHPEVGRDSDYSKFVKIQDLLRTLLQVTKIALEVSHNRNQIIVSNDGLRLPLEAYGTGIHQLIILAIAVLSKEKCVFCIEEPEIHMHPLLQRRLIDFLRNQTENKYVITTHSPALLGFNEDVAIAHIWHDGATKARIVESTVQSLQVLHDLGVQASDILQANSVLWVEGPSDRIYLNAWLRLIDPNLKENIDYCIMFYGGKLLSHATMNREEETQELVKLFRINQHSAILIDSDRSKATDSINSTKERIKEECDQNGVLCWISAGREIENYLPVEAISEAYAQLTGTRPILKFTRFARLEKALRNSYQSAWQSSWSYDTNKPEMARKISARFSGKPFSLDLGDQLRRLIRVIRHPIGSLAEEAEKASGV